MQKCLGNCEVCKHRIKFLTDYTQRTKCVCENRSFEG